MLTLLLGARVKVTDVEHKKQVPAKPPKTGLETVVETVKGESGIVVSVAPANGGEGACLTILTDSGKLIDCHTGYIESCKLAADKPQKQQEK